MNTRERQREERRARASEGADGSGATGAGELQERASQLLAASDRLIERALSVDSLQFLSQTRQAGGQ
jgi:hypothetical protein